MFIWLYGSIFFMATGDVNFEPLDGTLRDVGSVWSTSSPQVAYLQPFSIGFQFSSHT